jgi:hypothetical protein
MFKKKIEFLLAHVKNVSSKYKNIKLFISMKELFPILNKWMEMIFFFLKKKTRSKNAWKWVTAIYNWGIMKLLVCTNRGWDTS